MKLPARIGGEKHQTFLTVEFVGFGVVHVDCNHFPISLPLVDHGEDAEHLHPDHVTAGAHLMEDSVSGLFWGSRYADFPCANADIEPFPSK